MTITPNKWELDVQGYLNTCNITSATPRKQIRDFAAGVNDLGLWNSMVCWPLRSSQNYGSGTTAFSLGGLGTFNGTLVNGPSWGVDGVTFVNASSQHILLGEAQIIAGPSDFTYMGVAQLVDVAVTNLAILGGGNGRSILRAPSNGSTQIGNVAGKADGSLFTPMLSNGPTTSMFATFLNGDAANAKSYINSGSPYSTLTGDYRIRQISVREYIGANIVPANTTNMWNGLIAAATMWNVKLTDSQVAIVLSLYKSTLGTGLGLP